MMNSFKFVVLVGLLSSLTIEYAFSQNNEAVEGKNTPARQEMQLSESEWNAKNSDPVKLGWMQGFPPPNNKVIRGSDPDFFSFPKLRWSVCHFQQLLPSVEISRGIEPPNLFKRKPDPSIDDVMFLPIGSDKLITWKESLDANFTDGVVILHDGKIVYEKYFGCMDEFKKHAAMSVTKSFIGLLAEILVAEGTLDEHAIVRSIIPELRESAFGTATVRQVMDMTTAIRYSEDYSDPKADVWVYSAAGSPFPKASDYEGPQSYFDYLRTVKSDGTHGGSFAYKTPNTDVLGWIIIRTTGKSIAELLSQRIWRKIGAEQAAFITVDSTGTPFVGGGLNLGLRDLARVGQLMLNDGIHNGEALFPAKVVANIRRGGSQKAFAAAGFKSLPRGSYRSMWWVLHNSNGAFSARGVHGQTLYIDPTANMVIARFASHPRAKNAAIDPTSLPAYQAVADYLQSRSK